MNVTGNRLRLPRIGCQPRLAGISLLATLAACAQITPFEELPEVNRIWIAMEEGSIRPAAFEQIRSDSDSPARILKSDGDLLERGEVWAIVDPELIDLETRSLALDEKKIDRQIEKIREDNEDARRRGLLEARELEGRIAALQQSIGMEDFPASMRSATENAIRDMTERVAILHQRSSREAVDDAVQIESEELAMQLERKRRQLEGIERRMRLSTSFGGLLRFSDALRDEMSLRESEDEMVMVPPGEIMATIIDESRLEIVVHAASAALAEVPSDELAVFMQDGRTGRLIRGNHIRTEESEVGSDIIRTQVFQVLEEDVALARQAMGNRNLLHVYRMFPSPIRLVHKDQITFIAPDILEKSGWAGLCRHLWPEARVAHIGPQTIALEPDHAP